MIKLKLLKVSALVCLLLTACNSQKKEQVKFTSEIFFADPTIYYDNGKYYMTGTKNYEPLGFAIYESEDLKEWKSFTDQPLTMIMKAGNGSYGIKGFWAPQIVKNNDEYLLTYTANEQTVLAKSKSIYGPYKQEIIEPIDDTEKNIDSFIFTDTDGKTYLYHVRFDNGNYLWVAEFDKETGKINKETLKKCFDLTDDWEATPNYESVPVIEGPTVLKLKDKFYLFYSANHFMNIDYAMGYAVADSPYGPWVKNENNPILHRSIVHENGSGHGDVFEGENNQFYYVYHVHNSPTQVEPRRTRIVPLQLEWNEVKNFYDITVNEERIIKPFTIK